MPHSRKPSERRKAGRAMTRIDAVARTSQGARHKLEISDLSVGGCSVLAADHPLRQGSAYGIKISGLEVLGSIATWTAGQAAGLEFEQPLHPAVADHIAALNPPLLEEADAIGTEG
jgi:hypothetical protein